MILKQNYRKLRITINYDTCFIIAEFRVSPGGVPKKTNFVLIVLSRMQPAIRWDVTHFQYDPTEEIKTVQE